MSCKSYKLTSIASLAWPEEQAYVWQARAIFGGDFNMAVTRSEQTRNLRKCLQLRVTLSLTHRSAPVEERSLLWEGLVKVIVVFVRFDAGQVSKNNRPAIVWRAPR